MSPLKELQDTNYEDLPNLEPNFIDYRVNSASFRKPEKIGHFSSDLYKKNRTREMRFDESNLSYLDLPQSLDYLQLDLTEGYDRFKHINWANPSIDKLDEMLKWILKNRHLIESGNQAKPLDFDFITQRGVFTRIMCTPIVSDEWHIGFSKFKGTIYICPFFNDHDENESNFERLNMASYGGYRFEHYITKSKHQDTRMYDNNFSPTLHEYSALLKSKIHSMANRNGYHSLLYVAEIDCLEDKEQDSTRMENFVEIKTTSKINSHIQDENFHRYKSCKWWAQSKLVAIDRIICGYKENNLTTVTSIETLYVDDIARRAFRIWDYRDCWNFLDHFLTYVQNLLKNENDPSKVYLFSKERNSSTITCKKVLYSGNLLIIPDWYVNAFKCVNDVRKKNESNVK
ncbi:rat1 Interacting Protein 1 [Dermatophagoides farinae]|uniref:rat1 Interacting Protein 1 n=1 Tax=Dermatophagoides farinae TaxID=6954 RepID=UPI003F5F103C